MDSAGLDGLLAALTMEDAPKKGRHKKYVEVVLFAMPKIVVSYFLIDIYLLCTLLSIKPLNLSQKRF